MKKLFIAFLALGVISASHAQDKSWENLTLLPEPTFEDVQVVEEVDTSWKNGGVFGFNASQTLLNNWAAGGQSSITGTAFLSVFKNYAKDNWTWDNTLDLSYGLLNNGIIEGNTIKVDDRIDFASKAGRKAGGDWYYSALLNFRSQFSPGYEIVNGAENRDNKISDLLAPAFVLASIGMDYKPNDNFSVFISPITSKNTIVNDANSDLRANYGFATDELGQPIRFEVGGYFKLAYKRQLAENAEWQTKLDLFSNYLNNPQNVDVNWENLVSLKVAKYFNVNFILQLLYDDDIKIFQRAVRDENGLLNVIENPDGIEWSGDEVFETRGVSALQLRQVFGLGFSYKF